MIMVPLISLGSLLVTSVLGKVTKSPFAAIALALASGVWLVANKRLEGPILVTFTPRHGLTTSDLLGFLGYFYALRIIWVRYRGSTPHRNPWPLMAVCTVAFVVWPLAKILIWPRVNSDPLFSWIERLFG